jgi:hypothetical protein
VDEIRQTLQWRVGDSEYALIGAAEEWTFTTPEGTVALSTEGLDALARAIGLVHAGVEPARSTGLPATVAQRSRAGKPWTPGEDAELCDEHVIGMTQRWMAEQHDRSPGAIRARLVHLGLVDDSGGRTR